MKVLRKNMTPGVAENGAVIAVADKEDAVPAGRGVRMLHPLGLRPPELISF